MRVKRITQLIDAEQGIWLTSCLCEPGCVENRCLICEHRWQARPQGPITVCPLCDSFEIEWMNYDEWCKTHRSEVDDGEKR